MTKRFPALDVSRSSSTRQSLGTVLKLYMLLAACGAVVGSTSQIMLGLSQASSLAIAAVVTVPLAALCFRPWRLLQKS